MATRTIYIKFYKTDKGIEYKSLFQNGVAKDLNAAFEQLKNTDEIVHDLYYYYDDVEDAEIGSFEPMNGNRLIGRIPVKLYLTKEPPMGDLSHTVRYLLKNKDEIPKHQEYIKRLKNPRQDLITRLKNLIGGWDENKSKRY